MSATRRMAAILVKFKPLNGGDLKLDRSLHHETGHEDVTPRGQKELRPTTMWHLSQIVNLGREGEPGLMEVNVEQCSSGSVWTGSTTEQIWSPGLGGHKIDIHSGRRSGCLLRRTTEYSVVGKD